MTKNPLLGTTIEATFTQLGVLGEILTAHYENFPQGERPPVLSLVTAVLCDEVGKVLETLNILQLIAKGEIDGVTGETVTP